MVLGLRGFPDVQGGVEAHAENLYPLLAQLGCHVEVLVRSPYWSAERGDNWQGVNFRRLWSPRHRGLEAFVHSLVGVIYAGVKRPDILHIHAIGPAIVSPLARLMGLRVVVTHHGPDYEREKWNSFAKRVLRMGEKLGMRFSHQRIVISRVIADLVAVKYRLGSVLIPNGVTVPALPKSLEVLRRYRIAPGRYILCVSRFVPEKRQMDLIRAFASAQLKGWKLVLVGSIEPSDEYISSVQALAADTPGVVLTGFQSGKTLCELYAHAGIFVLPSSHEGHPIALLEALSFGLAVLASDIAPNLEIGLPAEKYFPLGDIPRLANSLRDSAALPPDSAKRLRLRAWLRQKYDWQKIAKDTLDVYRAVMN